MNRSPYLTTPARSLSEVTARRFWYSIGLLADPGQPSVFYRPATLAEKREMFAYVVRFNMRRGCCGNVRGNVVSNAAARVLAYAKRGCGSVSRESFRKEYAALREFGALS